MSTKQKNVDRQRRLRQQKRRSEFRHTRLVTNSEHRLYAALITRDWRDAGFAAIYLAREISPGRLTMLAFLVDLWGMGLKDAWGACDIGCSDFDEQTAKIRKGTRLVPVQLDLVRHMVYGGVERAKDLGLRLPKRYERWTTILGPLPPGESPDMSLFGCDGRIVLVCNRRDLEARLVGTSLERLLARPDVEAELMADDFTLVDEDMDEVMDVITAAEGKMVEAVRQWCFATGQAPDPLLPEVVSAMFEAMAQTIPEGLESEEDFENAPDSAFTPASRLTESFLRLSFEDRDAEVQAAVRQLVEFSRSHGSLEAFLAAVMKET